MLDSEHSDDLAKRQGRGGVKRKTIIGSGKRSVFLTWKNKRRHGREGWSFRGEKNRQLQVSGRKRASSQGLYLRDYARDLTNTEEEKRSVCIKSCRARRRKRRPFVLKKDVMSFISKTPKRNEAIAELQEKD